MSEIQAADQIQPHVYNNMLTGADEFVRVFVSREIGSPILGKTKAIGFMQGDDLVGGVVYSSLQLTLEGQPNSCELSMALTVTGAVTRGMIQEIFRYPFVDLGCKYVWGAVKRKAKHVRDIDRRLGFKLKCIIEDADPAGGDMALYYMRRKDCRWI